MYAFFTVGVLVLKYFILFFYLIIWKLCVLNSVDSSLDSTKQNNLKIVINRIVDHKFIKLSFL